MCVSAFLPQIYNLKKKEKETPFLLVFFLSAVSEELCPMSEAAKEQEERKREKESKIQ